jgi:phage tail-like protein
MPLNAEDIKASYPIPVYNYRVEINGEAVAFAEVSGLSIGYETSTYKESPTDGQAPGPRTMIVPGQRSAVKITLKKGLVRGASIKQLYGWIQTVTINQVVKKDISIRLCNEKGEAVISWTVVNAFPTKLDAPHFDAKSNDAAIESMELSADYVKLEES